MKNNYMIRITKDDITEPINIYNEERTAFEVISGMFDITYNMRGGWFVGYVYTDEYDEEGNEYMDEYNIHVISSPSKGFDLYDVYDRYLLGDYIDEFDCINYMMDDVEDMISAYAFEELYIELEGDHYYKNDQEFMKLVDKLAQFID